MIDNKKAKEVFEKYVESYDKSNPRIALKVEHTYRVAKVARQIATELNLSKEDIELAELIGLLHDIGRFEQLRLYDTFKDTISVDHAQMGIKVLQEKNFIKEFCQEEKYYNVIFTAISNHNKYKIEDNLDEKTLMHAQIIRDADKLDILNLLQFETFETLYKKHEIINEPISKEVYNSIFENKQVNRKEQKTSMDDWISNIGYIFDLNFIPSFNIIKENNYINKMIDRTKTDQMEKIREHVNEYINNKLK